jgi:hypothetical protein
MKLPKKGPTMSDEEKPGHVRRSEGEWITDPEDWRLKAAPRGEPGESIASGGWRCAAVMGFYGEQPDHVVGSPFYVLDPSGDTRHCCYCVECARKFVGVSPPEPTGGPLPR